MKLADIFNTPKKKKQIRDYNSLGSIVTFLLEEEKKEKKRELLSVVTPDLINHIMTDVGGFHPQTLNHMSGDHDMFDAGYKKMLDAFKGVIDNHKWQDIKDKETAMRMWSEADDAWDPKVFYKNITDFMLAQSPDTKVGRDTVAIGPMGKKTVYKAGRLDKL